VVDEDGNPVLDSRGNQVTKPRVIDTRSLVLSKDPMSLLGRSDLLLFVFCLTYVFTNGFLDLLSAGKMSHIRSMLNKANQKVTSQSSSRKRSEQRDQTADAWFPVRVSEDPTEEEKAPLKRKRIVPLDKGKQVQTQALVPSKGVSSAGEGLFQLPRVWSESDHFGPQASLYLNDSKMKAIHDLGVAGRSQAVTDRVVSAMRALEVAVYMNNSSMEDVVRSDALTRERGEMAKKMVEMEAELVAAKKSDLASCYSDELREARA